MGRHTPRCITKYFLVIKSLTITLFVTRLPNQTKVTNLSQGRLGESCKCEYCVLGTAAPAPIVEVRPASILATSSPRVKLPVDQIYTLILVQRVGTPI